MSGAVIVLRQNRFIRLYQEAGATGPAEAVAPEQLGIGRSWIFDRMAGAGVFVKAGEGRYYLSLEGAEAFRARRRRRAILFLGAVGAGVLLYLLIRRF